MSNWTKFRTSDLINNGLLEIGDGYRAKNSELGDIGLPFARVGNVNNGFHFEDADRFPEENLDKVGQKISIPGDVVFTSKGTVGRYAFVSEDIEPFVYSPQLCYWRSLDWNIINPRFLYYWMHGREFWVQVRGIKGQTDMADYVSLRDQRRMFVTLPDIEEQQAISAVLNAFDDKIELNRQTNATLEEMARAIFKSWFVDFDPVHAKARGEQPYGMDAETAALFPDRFEVVDGRKVPAGWRVGTIGDICDITIGGDWGKDKPFADSIEVYCLRGVDLERLRSNGWADPPIRWIKPSSLAKRTMDEQDVLVASSGVGPCGRSLWMIENLQDLYSIPITYSNFCKRFRTKNPATTLYLDRIFARIRESEEIWDYASGTSIPNLDHKGLMNGYEIIIPPDEILELFLKFYRPVAELLYSSESQTLTDLRDTLLPRLMSGQLRVGFDIQDRV